MLTTSRRQEDVQEMYAAGANTYIEKPQDFNRFVQVLQTIQRYWLDTAIAAGVGVGSRCPECSVLRTQYWVL